MYKVESGIQPPPHGRAIYPWATMKVGDSFFVENTGRNPPASCNGNRFGKFTVRKVEGGWRVWRTA